jgi:hypothetical protein
MNPITVLADGTPIGTSNLEGSDESMGVRFGRFFPSAGYRSVESLFQKYSKAVGTGTRSEADQVLLGEFYAEREKISFEVQDQDGLAIPIDAVTVSDFRSELGESAIEIEIVLSESMDCD